tara:strand:+ start:279 stop:824 length:546 start_codon:yes stop_codon:yes gene_type:complete
MATSSVVSSSNTSQKEHNSLMKRIQIEQNFANQAYANFKSVKFGISACCFTDFEDAILDKDICDWQNAKSDKIIVATNDDNVFLEPIAQVNEAASVSCPVISTNVCTILDLEDILADTGTYTYCQDAASVQWTITHNLGKFPSVTVVDSGNSVVIGDIDYTNSNVVVLTFNSAFSGCAFLN